MSEQDLGLFRNHFLERFRHDWWANRMLLSFLKGQAGGRSLSVQAGLDRAHRLFGHLLASELLWLGRIRDSGEKMQPVWGTRSLSELPPLLDRARGSWETYLESLTPMDFARIVSYQNTRGERYQHTLIQIVAHVLNHSTHHRAQILATLRGIDLEPPGLDYIVYLRAAPDELDEED